MEISVVIPTYNRETTLKRAIDSALFQSLPPSEIIVVDDGSTDATQKLLSSYNSIKILYQKNKGVSAARNLGIEACENEWIAFLDSDDEWKKDKLFKQMEFHEKNSSCKISYTGEKWIRDNKEIKIPKKHKKQTAPTFFSSLQHCQIGPSTVVAHKSIFKEIGKFDEKFEVCEDYDLWLRILKKNKIFLIDEPLTIKYAGALNQLSKKYWALERWHILSLFKHSDSEIVKEVIVDKCNGLKKAASKYKDYSIIDECELWLKKIK